MSVTAKKLTVNPDNLAKLMSSRQLRPESLAGMVRPETGDRRVSSKTIERMLSPSSSERFTRRVVEQVAEALGVLLSEIIVENEDHSSSLSQFCGDWLGMFIEPDRLNMPSLGREDIKISLAKGGKLIAEGAYVGNMYNDKVFYDFITAEKNTLRIASHIPGWTSPAGVTVMLLRLKEAGQLLEGIVTWEDSTTQNIETTSIFYVKDPIVNADLLEMYRTSIMEKLGC